MQWGTIEMGKSYIDITLPTAFKSTSYKSFVIDRDVAATTTQNVSMTFCIATSYTTTSKFRIISSHKNPASVQWFAIGY